MSRDIVESVTPLRTGPRVLPGNRPELLAEPISLPGSLGLVFDVLEGSRLVVARDGLRPEHSDQPTRRLSLSR